MGHPRVWMWRTPHLRRRPCPGGAEPIPPYAWTALCAPPTCCSTPEAGAPWCSTWETCRPSRPAACLWQPGTASACRQRSRARCFSCSRPWPAPPLPQSDEGKHRVARGGVARDSKAEGQLSLALVLPLVEAIGRDQAAPRAQRIAKGWPNDRGLGARIDHFVADCGLLRPPGNQSPSEAAPAAAPARPRPGESPQSPAPEPRCNARPIRHRAARTRRRSVPPGSPSCALTGTGHT